jgi:ADP-ribose pyrophosphatase
MTNSKLEILNRELLFDGFNRLTKLVYRYRRHNGEWSGAVEREIFERAPAAAVLPFDPAQDAVVMVEQFRPGAYLSGESAWQLEPIAGICDNGEVPEETAQREAIEEAGCTLGELVPICDYIASPGCVNEKVSVFCAKVDISTVPNWGGNVVEHEETKVHIVDFKTCMRYLNEGNFGYALTIIALQWLALNRDALREDWC